jgi:predicted CopG family antitoxin
MYDSCMSKTITIDDDVYKLLLSLKQGHGDSFTKVLRRHVHKPAETAGELLEAYASEPAPKAAPGALKRLLLQRGRRSGGRK